MKKSGMAGMAALLIGLVLAFASTAFKSADSAKLDMLIFEYAGPNYSEANVEDESKWQLAPEGEACSQDDEKACRIAVDQSFVNNPSSPTATLKSSLNIQAQLNSATSTHFVESTADEQAVISNTEY
ncbi:hypothetical protein BCY91_12665 [Pelobium manganitolerans]|uniref:Uncharacterized protein n=1 Tax=Pelobium manganitolerans TaxID=1842495 RepID=A0A419S1Z5_9SPHI|nr:hypothetical protein [Pelobium manganitolerans]RKD12490.1 hypothetical protein BCY91_12665 [Pelobium manganitolerans]